MEIKKIKLSLYNANAKADMECCLEEEVVRTSYVTPHIWREKYQKVELATRSVEHWKERFEALKREGLGWLSEKSHLSGLLDIFYAKSINLLQPAATMYRAKCDFFVRFCDALKKEVPWRLEDVLEDVDESSTPHSILRFIYLCERMMKRFKVELKELKECKTKRII